MNKQSVGKLGLFLTGLEQRINDNVQFFKKINIAFKSGTKEFSGVVTLEGDKLIFSFNGIKEKMETAWLSARVSKYAESYDSAVITYEERGITIVIEADNKNVRMKTKEASEEKASKAHSETSQISSRDYFIKVGQADELLKEIGILGENGKVKNDMIRKYNQIDHFVELISDTLKDLATRYDTLNILDCGCGKSYLTFVLNYYIKEVLKKSCYFIGLDYSGVVVEASRKMALNLGYRNMEFKVTDIRDYRANKEIHLVISLHACDTATDEAIALGVNNEVESMVIVPCCHRQILNQYKFQAFEPILKHGILKARMADILTDGLRALLLEGLGYKVSVVEYISPLETPKNLMLRAEKIQEANNAALLQYKQLKELLGVEPELEKLVYK
ncbi:MAG: SAM-dependent methyltransferase [Clostridia bacterium]|nr:SAM-dependent methyltransferase [Clostridia bacterium]